MYNKLFSRILTSSIWTQDYATRIVWITLLAAMDEDGVAHFATPRNVAAIAQVTLEEAEAALRVLESPDPHSSNPDNEGRRAERIPGGWLVLNATAYRSLQRRTDSREAHAARMRRYRDRSVGDHVTVDRDGSVTPVRSVTVDRDGSVTPVRSVTGGCDGSVTPVTAHTEAEAEEERSRSSRRDDHPPEGFAEFWSAYPKKIAKPRAVKAWRALRPDPALQATILAALAASVRSGKWLENDGEFIPHPATYLNDRRWKDAVVLAAQPSATVEAERQRSAALLDQMRAQEAERARLLAARKAQAEEAVAAARRQVQA